MFQLLTIIPYVERFGAGMLLTLHVLLSEWCVRFGAGIVVRFACRCKVLVRGVACGQSGVYSLGRGWWRSWQPEPSPSSASSTTQQAASHAASQLQLASPSASHPTSSSNWAGHLTSQPPTQPPRASQLRDNDETLCAWRRFATLWRYVKVARDHRVWPTLVNKFVRSIITSEANAIPKETFIIVIFWGMIRGYDSGVLFRVWFGGVIRTNRISCLY